MPHALHENPPAIGELSLLPVFFSLAAQPTLVIGATPAAAWKAELLCSAGAQVNVVASTLSPAMRDLMNGRYRHQIQHHSTVWSTESFNGKALAIADAASEQDAQALQRAARSAGVPLNVIDRPNYCHFQFGSIVNRSPVVISISTTGSAPILAQAIRRRIEALLPTDLANWALLARRLRATIMARLPVGAARRHFWESFVDKVFDVDTPLSSQTSIEQEIDALPADSVVRLGSVTTIQCESDDSELLTFKDVRALQRADVVIYDANLPADILQFCRREATRVAIDSSEIHSSNDNRIDIQLARTPMATHYAKQGHAVVRLTRAVQNRASH